MSPYQKETARSFGGVIIIDVSEGRNMYNMYLTTMIVVDGENRSKSVAYCLSSSQDTDMFTWLLKSYSIALYGSNNIAPIECLFSDRAVSIANACRTVWPHVFHGVCLWHLAQNIIRNLGSRLGDNFNLFMDHFWHVYGMGSPATFKIAWQKLLQNWPKAIRYLEDHIAPD